MTEQIRRLEEAIETMAAEKYPEVELLTQVAGVGPPTSLTFIPTIGDPTRFRRKRDVAAYLGLVPRGATSSARPTANAHQQGGRHPSSTTSGEAPRNPFSAPSGRTPR